MRRRPSHSSERENGDRSDCLADLTEEAMEWLSRNAEVTPTSADYLSAASMKASAKKLGLIVELPDCLIASIALRLGLPLVTGNTADYESIQRTGVPLVLQNWRED